MKKSRMKRARKRRAETRKSRNEGKGWRKKKKQSKKNI